jgi:hypothetical protein
MEEMRREIERLAAQETLLPPEHQRLRKLLDQKRELLAQREASCMRQVSLLSHR